MADNCLNCGKEIEQTAGKKARLYCGDACRIAYGRRKSEQVKSEQIKSEQGDCVKSEQQVILGRESHRGLVEVGDKLVPGNKDIYQRPDGTRYIIDACGTKIDFPER